MKYIVADPCLRKKYDAKNTSEGAIQIVKTGSDGGFDGYGKLYGEVGTDIAAIGLYRYEPSDWRFEETIYTDGDGYVVFEADNDEEAIDLFNDDNNEWVKGKDDAEDEWGGEE